MELGCIAREANAGLSCTAEEAARLAAGESDEWLVLQRQQKKNIYPEHETWSEVHHLGGGHQHGYHGPWSSFGEKV